MTNNEWKQRWPNFSKNELFNPIFDDCNKNSLDEFDDRVKYRLIANLDMLQYIRHLWGKSIQLNSTYRHHDSAGKPHKSFGAIDHQIIMNDVYYIYFLNELFHLQKMNILNYIRKYNSQVKGIRIFYETSNGASFWVHSDIDYENSKYPSKNIQQNEIRIMIGFKMPDGSYCYEKYDGKNPLERYKEVRLQRGKK